MASHAKKRKKEKYVCVCMYMHIYMILHQEDLHDWCPKLHDRCLIIREKVQWFLIALVFIISYYLLLLGQTYVETIFSKREEGSFKNCYSPNSELKCDTWLEWIGVEIIHNGRVSIYARWIASAKITYEYTKQ